MQETFSWIKDFFDSNRRLVSISDLIPNIFEKYFLVPWNYGIIDDFPFDTYPLSKETVEDLQICHRIEKQFGIFLNDSPTSYRPVSIKELAGRFDVPYCANTVDHIKPTPGIRPLVQQTELTITKLIQSLNADGMLNLFIADNYLLEASVSHWSWKTESVLADVKDYILFQRESYWDTTSYFFPENIGWCLVTCEDFDHFIVAASTRQIGSVTGIEMFETSPESLLWGSAPNTGLP